MQISPWRSSQFGRKSNQQAGTIKFAKYQGYSYQVDIKLCGKVGSLEDILEEVAFRLILDG